MKRIGVLTGGGDAPALNAVLRAITRYANNEGISVLGFQEGWKGIIEGIPMPLDWSNTDNIIGEGGTILGSSRTNPFKREGGVEGIIENFRRYDLDAFIAIGGDDTLGVANRLYLEKGFPIIGVPKTIDNDLSATDFTFGFDTAVNRAVEAIDSLVTTARSHRRVMVVEIMGRHAGWIAAYAGIASGADVVLVPERPFSIDSVAETLKKNRYQGKLYNIVAIAEGATLAEGESFVTLTSDKDEFGHVRLGGIAEELSKELQKRTGFESRHVVLGHLQRGGSPSAFDRILGTRLGLKAYELARDGQFGKMVALKGNEIVAVSLQEGVGKLKLLHEEYLRIIDTFTA
ncbi:MAG: 6-phosphofructokinase [Planctomycetota bacterium]